MYRYTITRILMLSILVGLANTAQATLIEDLIGDVKLAPVAVTLDTPDAATAIDGTLHVVGSHNGQAARQLVDLTTGIVGAIEFFDSLASAAGGTGDTTGLIREVTQLTSGEVLYVGDSAGSFSVEQPTSWLTPNDPKGGVGSVGAQVGGTYFGISDNGTIVGTTNNAVYGSHDNLPQLLPDGISATLAVDITNDSSFIAGGLLWEKNTIGSYDVLNTSGFDFTTSGGTPTWEAVAIDPIVGDAVFAGSFLDFNTFTNKVGFWRADGSYLYSSLGDSTFVDFEIVSGELVAATVDPTDTTIYSITDGSSINLEAVLGFKTLLADDGLFAGSLGFLGSNSAGGIFVATATPVPEPSTLFLAAIGVSLIGLRSRLQRNKS